MNICICNNCGAAFNGHVHGLQCPLCDSKRIGKNQTMHEVYSRAWPQASEDLIQRMFEIGYNLILHGQVL